VKNGEIIVVKMKIVGWLYLQHVWNTKEQLQRFSLNGNQSSIYALAVALASLVDDFVEEGGGAFGAFVVEVADFVAD
jgi:hypothetical protein